MTAAGTAKKAGAVRIGIVTPKAQMTGSDAARAAEALRNTFAKYLNGPTIEVVALTARMPSQALEEAKGSGCDYVLHTSLTHKKGGGGGGMFGKALGNIAGAAVGHIPINTAGDAAARSAAITGIYTTANIAGSVKAKDELTLDYKLEATDAAKPGVAKVEKAKAKSDGEDVLTPLIEKAAESIVAATKK
jgi:CheY-like chemotaxis protein